MPTVTAIIIHYQKPQETIAAIHSLLKSQGVIVRIIIVNNGTEAALAPVQHAFPSLPYIQNKTNMGFAHAVNQGIRKALGENSDYVLLINDDATVSPTTLSQLIAPCDRDPLTMIVGPTIYYATQRNKIWQAGGFFSYARMNIHMPQKNVIRNEINDEPQQVDFVTGCVMLIRSKLFEQIGYFDEQYYFYVEDLDFCWRTHTAHHIYYVPQAKAWHQIETGGSKRANTFALEQLSKSMTIFYQKNFSFIQRVYAITLLITVYAFVRVLQKKSSQALIPWYRGVWKGLIGYR